MDRTINKKKNIHKSEAQKNQIIRHIHIDKYKVSENITEYYIASKLIFSKNHH